MIKQLLRLPKIGMALTKSFSETLTALLQSCLCVCVFEVWRLWITGSTWVSKEQNLAHR
ncbi:unnamed protein product [Brassica rapa subsp. trilocularis]